MHIMCRKRCRGPSGGGMVGGWVDGVENSLVELFSVQKMQYSEFLRTRGICATTMLFRYYYYSGAKTTIQNSCNAHR